METEPDVDPSLPSGNQGTDDPPPDPKEPTG